MTKRMTLVKPQSTTLLLLAAIGIAGLFVARRYGVVSGLRAVNSALGIAPAVRPSASRSARKRPARRVRSKVLRFSKPG